MKKACIVDELGCSRKIDGIVIDGPNGIGHKQGDHGPYHLALVLKDMTVALFKKRDVGTERLLYKSSHPAHIRLYVSLQFFH